MHKTISSFKFRALISHFGVYDLSSFLPATHNFKKPSIVDCFIVQVYTNLFLPKTTPEQRCDPTIFPFLVDCMTIARRMKRALSSALLTCGAEDQLLDDGAMTATKWLIADGRWP